MARAQPGAEALLPFGAWRARPRSSARILPQLAESNGSHSEGHPFRPGRQPDSDWCGRGQFRSDPSPLVGGQIESWRYWEGISPECVAPLTVTIRTYIVCLK